MDGHPPRALTVPSEIVAHLLAHAAWAAPDEACGLLLGPAPGEVAFFVAATNLDSSPRSFTVDPAEHFWAWKLAEQRGWEVVGSFHSHPRGPLRPSASDIAGALDPRWCYLIGSEREVAAFWIRGGAVFQAARFGA